MEAIKRVYYYQKRKNLPIYGVQTPNLAKYTTSADDIKIGVSRRPPANQRRKSQDLFDESTSVNNPKPAPTEEVQRLNQQ